MARKNNKNNEMMQDTMNTEVVESTESTEVVENTESIESTETESTERPVSSQKEETDNTVELCDINFSENSDSFLEETKRFYFVGLPNVKNMDYFKKAMRYRKYRDNYRICTERISKLSQTIEKDSTPASAIDGLKALRNQYQTCHDAQETLANDILSEMHVTAEDIMSDKFLELACHVAWGLELTIPNDIVTDLMTALKEHRKQERETGMFSEETKNAVKNVGIQLQRCASRFETRTNDNYVRCHVRVGKQGIAHTVHSFENKWKVELGKVTGITYKAPKAMKEDIAKYFMGKIQKSIIETNAPVITSEVENMTEEEKQAINDIITDTANDSIRKTIIDIHDGNKEAIKEDMQALSAEDKETLELLLSVNKTA